MTAFCPRTWLNKIWTSWKISAVLKNMVISEEDHLETIWSNQSEQDLLWPTHTSTKINESFFTTFCVTCVGDADAAPQNATETYAK